MPKKVLIIGPNWVGDMLMAQSLFKLLKYQDPDILIDVVAPTWTVGLLSRMSEVRLAMEASFKHLKFNPYQHFLLAQQLRKNEYDQAIVLPNSLKSALTPWLAGIKKRTGWLGENRYFFLNDIRHLETTKYPLMIERYMALGLESNTELSKPYFFPELNVCIESRNDLLKQNPALVSERPILAMCIGAEYGVSKCWPPEHYATVANQKIREGWDIWLIGSSKESENAKKIMHLTHDQCQDLTGRFSLVNVIDLLSLVSAVITNDTGLMHIAAALKKPMIALYGSSSPNFTPPLTNTAIIKQLNLDCQPCFKRSCPLEHHQCMLNLKPETILEVMEQW